MSAGLAAAAGGALLAQPVNEGPLVGFQLVGLISCAATLASLYLAGRLRPAPGGELAPDALALPTDEQREPVETADRRLAIHCRSDRIASSPSPASTFEDRT
jgi:hypothetical protein